MHTLPETFKNCKPIPSEERCPECNAILYNKRLNIDKTEFNDGSVEYELELELSDTSKIETIEANLRKLFLTLDIPFIRQTESKFARALKKANIL